MVLLFPIYKLIQIDISSGIRGYKTTLKTFPLFYLYR
nr:MAG TPA: hypothetical protein [Caudoviricetes sp.]